MNAIDFGAVQQRQAQDQIERGYKIADAEDLAYVALRDELRGAILHNPTRSVWTPGWGDKRTPAFEVVQDHFAGRSGDADLIGLLTILGQAAQGHNVAEAARTLLGKLCAEHAEFHAADAVEA